MANFRTFAKDIQLATAGIEPAEIAKQLAALARSELAAAIASKEASPVYDKYVTQGAGHGVKGADESTVVPPGPILYVFAYWEPIIKFTLAFLKQRSPKRSGRYAGSHIVMVGSQVMRPDAPIGPDEEVSIVATTPYARKIEVGHMRMSVPRGVYQDARKAVTREFGGADGPIEVQFRQIRIPGGYILKGKFRRGFRKHARKGLRPDTQAGAVMTYPALIMNMRGI